MEAIFIGLIIGGIFAFIIIKASLEERKNALRFIENHKKIKCGMNKSQVVNILGNTYTQSYLKNGIEKLEWRYRHAGYTGRVAKGYYVHSGQLTRKISVKFKDDIVIEVKSLNMD